MRMERKRIFISDLPETATEDDIREAFQCYGDVASVEIKTRKLLGSQHTSLHFGYVNIDIDDNTLRKCFKEFANKKWHNQYVMLQLAKESFLERLKREREQNADSRNKTESTDFIPIKSEPSNLQNGYMDIVKQQSSNPNTDSKTAVKVPTIKSERCSSTESSSDGPALLKLPIIKPEKEQSSAESSEESTSAWNIPSVKSEPEPDVVIKNNRGKVLNKNGLKIPSFGNEPIAKVEPKKRVENLTDANQKRLETLKRLKKEYQTQKSLIKAALTNVDSRPKNRIMFENADSTFEAIVAKKQNQNKKSKNLFDDDSEEDFEADFAVKEQFQGQEGQKLLQLQSKYKHDKRFVLDARFLDNEEHTSNNSNSNNAEAEDISIQEEKKKEYEILNELLGNKVTPKFAIKSESQKKTMLRFDPTHPEHTRFEVKKPVEKDKKKKRKEKQIELIEEKKAEDKEAPIVSKEVFYKVTEDLKESLQEKKEFSLLGMFGRVDEKDTVMEEVNQSATPINKVMAVSNGNPFKYDSSDDEDETEEILKQNVDSEKVDEKTSGGNARRNYWTESFFFKDDDYRLQEGYEFIERMKSEEDPEDFGKLRRNLKEIVKAKIKNNQRKNRPFKKKLGGNKRKKIIRLKKAMKR